MCSSSSSPDAETQLRMNTYKAITDKEYRNACDRCDWICDLGYYLTNRSASYNWNCTQCPANSYSDVQGATSVSSCKCNAGYYGKDGSCTPCAAGTYSHERGLTACLSCTAGINYSSSTGATTCTACSSNCIAGQYRVSACNATRNLACESCSTGKNSVIPNQLPESEVCLCAAGYFYNETTCHACEAGKYKNTTGNAQMCTTCSANYFSKEGQSTCKSCPPNCGAGYYWDNATTCNNSYYECKSCPNGATSDWPRLSISSCYCNAGYYYKDHTDGCQACGIGKFSNVTGLTRCYDCTSGVNYAKESVNQQCIACSTCTGTTPYQTGACTSSNDTICAACHDYSSYKSERSKCVCNDGYGYELSSCVQCKAGKYSNNTVNDNPCQSCASFTWSAAGATVCSSCDNATACLSSEIKSDTCDQTTGRYCKTTCAGSYQSVLNSTCVCSAGYYTNSSSGDCVACPAGKYQDTQNQTECKPCGDSQFNVETGKSACTQCKTCGAGKYVSINCTATQNRDCGSCTAGKTSNAGAMQESDCFNCSAGQFSRGGEVCSPCPVGTYNPFAGMQICMFCAIDNWAPPGSTSMTACRSPKSPQSTCSNIPKFAVINSDMYYYVESSSGCSPCPSFCTSGSALNGTCAGKGTLECVPCSSSNACTVKISFTATTNRTTLASFTTAVKNLGSSWSNVAVTSSSDTTLVGTDITYYFSTFVTQVTVTSNTESAFLSYRDLQSKLLLQGVQLLSIDGSIQYLATFTPPSPPANVFFYVKSSAPVTREVFLQNEGDLKQALINAAKPVVVASVEITILSSTRRANSVEYSAKLGVADAAASASAQKNVVQNIASEFAKYSSLSSYSTSLQIADAPFTDPSLSTGSTKNPFPHLLTVCMILATIRAI